jgi:hypothetical protein
MKKITRKLQLSRETLQNLITEGQGLRVAGGVASEGVACTKLGICTHTCGHLSPQPRDASLRLRGGAPGRRG